MTARYLAIAEDLSSKIMDGHWKLGAFLPSEPELAAAYSVSRETLRGALRQLEEVGLISRRKGQGTRVVRLKPAHEFHTRLSSIEELAQYGRSAVRRIISIDRIAVGDGLADDLGVPAGTTRTCITSTRQDPDDGGQPLSWAQVYLTPEDADLVQDEVRDSDRLVADLVAERTGRQVNRVLQRIKATALSDEAAQALGELPGSIALQLTRRYLDSKGHVLAVAVSTHPGARFAYESVLERS
ncbi:GntR family transcriptional regulator [Pseudarthrobacter sp. NPDC058119]|uniref:GntR family transcriptional regulator n=1 Tax=Pseudarthrobacter sp. NPDC058119 TaxID=3346348 RepID=UPI0036DF195F